jgi:hypothetical protein
MDPQIDRQMAGFFAWARPRAYEEFERRLREDPTLDPNWTFSDIMQELLAVYRQSGSGERLPATTPPADRTSLDS